MKTTCSCGCTEAHVVARRHTADGIALVGWSDGQITYRLGLFLRGPGARAKLTLSAMWRLLDNVCLYDLVEVPGLIRAAKGVR